MQITNNIDGIGFQGKFLSEKTVTKAIEASKQNFIKTKYAQGVAFDKAVLSDFDTKGATILQNLKTLASKLPDDFDLVLEKTKDGNYGEKAFCLNIRHEGLDDVEVFGNISRHHKANVRDNFMNGYSLEGIETAMEGWELLNPKEMISKYICFTCRRLNIKSLNLKKKLAVIDTIAKNNWLSLSTQTERTGIDSKLAAIKEQEKNRREITLFKLKRAFGFEK